MGPDLEGRGRPGATADPVRERTGGVDCAPSAGPGTEDRILSRAPWGLLALLLTTAAASDRSAVAPESHRIRVLSYNVHGFWLRGHPLDSGERSRLIGERVVDYDLALLQEDFEYHDLVSGDGTLSIRERGNGPREHWALSLFRGVTAPIRWLNPRSDMPYGSGLTILSPRLAPVRGEVTREFLGACHGWFGGANDCLASKGFLRVRVRLGEMALDVYDTHLDAGRGEGDREARRRQLEQWARRIQELSGDLPLIVAGDFNTRYAEGSGGPLPGPDWEPLRRFMTRLGLRDTGAAPAPGSDWEQLDYILVRGSPDVRVDVIERGEDAGFYREGIPLSDHPGIFAEVEIRRAGSRGSGRDPLAVRGAEVDGERGDPGAGGVADPVERRISG